jgi:adenylosuccinate lyase
VIDRYARPAMKLVWSEDNKNDKWLQVELAVCEAWTEEGIIPQEDMVKLRGARYDAARMKEVFERTRHDMTAFLQSVTAGLGEEGRWLHMGLTSHDVQDTAQSLQLVQACDLLLEDIDRLVAAIKKRAIEHKNTPMMGRTHGVHAEPTTFGLKLALWWDEMGRNRHRLEEARKSIAVGKISGVVGTYATVPPQIEERVCAQFGISPAPVSNQVVQRDRHAQFVTTLAIIAASLEKFATEVRGLQRTEVREVEEPFGQGQTGSSAMPHKKNPELSERVCGLARLIRGHSVTALENVALWHERDISHSSAERLILPDSCMALDYILGIFTGVVDGLRVYPQRMWSNIELTKGLVFSQRVLIALLESGLSREKSYEIVQVCAMRSWEESADFRQLLREQPEVTERLPGDALESIFDYDFYMQYVEYSFLRLGLEGV